MEDTSKVEKLSSAAAFVEGGIQDACEDACSICLEEFSESDPSTVTVCKHEYHLQCILEWCQRSSQCPMCWESISLKDPTSQELLKAVERERSFRQHQPRTTTIFRHPTLGDFELQHLPVDASEADLEERIIQHLAAAASMGRPHISRREGHRGRSRGHGHPQYLVFPAHPNSPPFGPFSASSGQIAAENDHGSATNAAGPSVPVITLGEFPPLQVSSTQDVQILGLSSSSGQNTSVNQDRAGPSDLQSFSESLKSRINAVSTRYKESVIKSTRGWRERLFSRNQSVPDVHIEVTTNDPGIETVSHGIINLDMRENSRGASSVGQRSEEHPPTLPTAPETRTEVVLSNTKGPSVSSSTTSDLN